MIGHPQEKGFTQIDIRVKTVVSIMKNNLHYPWQSWELAQQVLVSERHLRRLFSENLGCCPLEYSRNLRLDKAGELLISTFKPISQIAREVGIRDPNNFRRDFKKLYKITPTEFRQLRENKVNACPL